MADRPRGSAFSSAPGFSGRVVSPWGACSEMGHIGKPIRNLDAGPDGHGMVKREHPAVTTVWRLTLWSVGKSRVEPLSGDGD